MKSLKVLPLIVFGVLSTSNANAVDIKQQQIDNCINGSLKHKIADRPTATKLCSCTIGVRSRMTIGQMWEIESYAQNGQDPSELPYVVKMQHDLQQCTSGLKLNPPEK